MISTVTTSTVSTVTTAVIAGSLALIGIIVLLSLLIHKEIASANTSERVRKFNLALNIVNCTLADRFYPYCCV